MKLNENGECIVEHHTHYKEIHGFDRTVWMTASEHRKLHNRLRREGRCRMPANKLDKISRAARVRTDKQQNQISRYNRNNIHRKCFTKSFGDNTILRERILINSKTDTVTYNSTFEGNHGYKIPIVDVV